MSEVSHVRAMYIEQGYDCIPLKPMSKLPLSKGWQYREPFRQWQGASAGVNFGLRAGNGKAFIDCDTKNDPATTDNVIRWLAGLGVTNYPVVQTPSGGAHIYVNFAGAMLGSSRKLTNQIGAGEFRYSNGAQIAAPPSILETGAYRLIQGDTAQLPTLYISDITALVNVNETVAEQKPEPKMSVLARALSAGNLEVLGDRYNNDMSDAEGALVLSLINSGFDFAQIKHIFETQPCAGHYRTAKNRVAYLERTYSEMLKYSQRESPTRRTIRELQEMADRASWNNANDKNVFLAHTRIAYKAGRFEYAASSRDLALGAGVAGNKTALNATRRLMGSELLKLQEKSAAVFAHRYLLQVDKITHFLTSKYLGSVSFCPSQVVENGRVLDLEELETSDAFRNGRNRLGRRAAQVYKILFTESLTTSEIVSRTTASPKTIGRILKKLSAVRDYKTGEILEMVTRDESGRWHSKVVDLEILEAIYGTRGARAKQRQEYERERREHARSLEIGATRTATSNENMR